MRAQITQEVRASVAKEVTESIINVLSAKFLGTSVAPTSAAASIEFVAVATPKAPVKTAAQTVSEIKSVAIRKEKSENAIWEVQLGNTKEQGGTRGITYKVGGATCMPFHLWEGTMPNKPLVAMEVYDVVSKKYPKLLRKVYGDLLNDPAAMAKVCVEQYGADLISVRLDGTHPERGNKKPEDAVAVVKSVLAAVEVPIIVTGHNSFEKNNEVFKAIAQSCEGENLLFNWVEQDNYRTIAGAAMAYGHTLVAQSPIDVNIGKQINILLSNMDLKKERIIMDPMTGAIGYGIEYSYSVMERIRLTALNGDKMLCAPMIVSPGMECIKIKEYKASEEDFPTWGELEKRAITWELTTAVSLLQAGADILIMYHPEAVKATQKTINDLLDKAGE
ncbi:MAG: acetyl-CoA decarbonylase/synthase complex subunit delta [Clostridiales bacterium]|nr:acetyl-CoA decarbonylase/synthase complex subunit delta [Clostridiales bacterium]